MPLKNLARRPAELASAEQVGVEVAEGLTAVVPLVNYQSIPVGQSLGLRDLLGSVENVQMVSRFRKLREARDLRLGDDQDVHRCLRFDVPNRENVVVLIDEVAGNLAIEDLGEERGYGNLRLTLWSARACSRFASRQLAAGPRVHV